MWLLFTGGKPKLVRTSARSYQKGDVIGCLIDLSVPEMTFTVNGNRIRGFFRDFNLDGMFYPVISVSAKVRYVSCDKQILPIVS